MLLGKGRARENKSFRKSLRTSEAWKTEARKTEASKTLA
jgi:hypothetical protein